MRMAGHSPSGSYSEGTPRHTCPACKRHGLVRIRRRFIDRLIGLFVRQRRYRCTHPACLWEGNLREKRRTQHLA
ncbi:hypothetical protein [Thiobacillus sedimenti]|uniref:Transposase IS204/IS1001/IS1096/IS1165 zinc-finger domain-containing protein n=1 Tax=Thiobacillus sedimenti TaxID=3110231 RepID=A0ABZ1CFZ6_9PROT|nr:hypothetical protein [Thiobacillus sp. SCUT-2]WRS37841.1 hypothetical protein VA613_07365 [Thiobacillus sp. SCUT-2]